MSSAKLCNAWRAEHLIAHIVVAHCQAGKGLGEINGGHGRRGGIGGFRQVNTQGAGGEIEVVDREGVVDDQVAVLFDEGELAIQTLPRIVRLSMAMEASDNHLAVKEDAPQLVGIRNRVPTLPTEVGVLIESDTPVQLIITEAAVEAIVSCTSSERICALLA